MSWKVEKRTLERIGRVIRMGDESMTKSVVLGWLEKLERWPRQKGRKRKTVRFWEKLLREAGIDWTNLDELTKDRKEWRKLVTERMAILEI